MDKEKDAEIIQFSQYRQFQASQPTNELSQDSNLSITDISSHPKRSSSSTGDSVNYRLHNGEIELLVTINGRKYRFGDSRLEQWAEGLLSAIRERKRINRDDEVMRLWNRAVRGETIILPASKEGGMYKCEEDQIKERLSRATALSVARLFYSLGLEAISAQRIAEDLTGHKLTKASDPASRGESFDCGMRGRIGAVILLKWWREKLTKKGITPIKLKMRSKEDDEKLKLAQEIQRKSGDPYFTYQRSKRGWIVWLWKGGGGMNLASDKTAPYFAHKSEAIEWAKIYSSKHIFKYAEFVTSLTDQQK